MNSAILCTVSRSPSAGCGYLGSTPTDAPAPAPSFRSAPGRRHPRGCEWRHAPQDAPFAGGGLIQWQPLRSERLWQPPDPVHGHRAPKAGLVEAEQTTKSLQQPLAQIQYIFAFDTYTQKDSQQFGLAKASAPTGARRSRGRSSSARSAIRYVDSRSFSIPLM